MGKQYRVKRGRDLSRKAKKALFGRRINRSKLFRYYQQIVFIEHPRTIYDSILFICPGPEALFCPRCGCVAMDSVDNFAQYPEMWIEFYCSRCGLKVGDIDNSPFFHLLAIAKEAETEEGRFSKRDFEKFITEDIW